MDSLKGNGTTRGPVNTWTANSHTMGAGTWGAGWATAHPGKNQGGHY